jgi:hypothetical protein
VLLSRSEPGARATGELRTTRIILCYGQMQAAPIRTQSASRRSAWVDDRRVAFDCEYPFDWSRRAPAGCVFCTPDLWHGFVTRVRSGKFLILFLIVIVIGCACVGCHALHAPNCGTGFQPVTRSYPDQNRKRERVGISEPRAQVEDPPGWTTGESIRTPSASKWVLFPPPERRSSVY